MKNLFIYFQIVMFSLIFNGLSYGQKITGTTAAASSGAANDVVDGNLGTRWGSNSTDSEWITVDLRNSYDIGKVVIIWEYASAQDYTLEGSDNNIDWTTIESKTGLPEGGRTDEFKGLNVKFRYVKMNGTKRSTIYGYSIFEFEVYQNVAPVLSSLTINPDNSLIQPGDSKQYTITGKDQNNENFDLTGSTIEWTVNGYGCSITTDGLLTSTVVGNYVVSAACKGISSNTSTLKVSHPLITGTNFGSVPPPTGHEPDKAFDNNINTFFDYSQPDGGYTGVKLNSGKVITKIRFYPRGWEQYLIDRMIGGKFQGSNTGENEGYTDLYTITTSPNSELNEVIINDLNAYTYIRYIGPNGGYCDVSEIEFYDASSALITGTIFGSVPPPTGHEPDKAFDNDNGTFFDYSQSDGGYTGVKLNSVNGKVITKIRFYPRGWEQYFIDRMIGGKFQGSNTGENEGYTDLYTITTTPNSQWNEVIINNPNAYTYIRYIGPNGGYCNVSEIEFYGYEKSNDGNTFTYKLSNPRITRSDGLDWFEFDVQVKASVDGTYLASALVEFDFNNTSLSTTSWTTTLAAPFIASNSDGSGAKYLTTQAFNGTPSHYSIEVLGNSGSLTRVPYNTSDWVQMTTSYQQLMSVKGLITSNTGVADVTPYILNLEGRQNNITAPGTYLAYGSVSFDPANFTNTYLGRIYANSTWTQTGGSTNGVPFTDWAVPVNTSVWDGTATLTGGTEQIASALRVHSGATLTIPVDGKLTVTGATDVITANGLIIQSNATGTGSLITGSATGSAIAQRFLSAGKWNIVSSPLVQSVSSFLTDNAGIAKNDNDGRGILEYLPVTNDWSLPSATGPAGNLGVGKGFSMRLQEATDAAVTFTGTLQAGAVSASANAGYWNCIGNPYTSAIGITNGSSSSVNFLTVNNANFETNFGAIYVWNKPDASNGNTGNYTTISNTAPEFNEVQQGQAFLVNAKNGVTSFNFTSTMQSHLPALTLKSTDNVWPTIKLQATVGSQKSSTVIAFNNGMTKGMDQTYDAGLLKGGSDLIVYSMLVEDNGIPFAIQALPSNDYKGMIIPLGLDFKTGGDVVFSSALLNLPSDCNVILEDQLLKKFTDLSKNVYTVAIAANSSTSDRFRLHTSYQTTGLDVSNDFGGKLFAYSIRNTEIRINGNLSNHAVATLYDVQGRVVVIKNLEEGSINSIATPNIKTGIYMLYVKDNNKVQGFKIPVRE